MRHWLFIQPSGFIGILEFAEQSFREWVCIINDLLGKVQPGCVTMSGMGHNEYIHVDSCNYIGVVLMHHERA